MGSSLWLSRRRRGLSGPAAAAASALFAVSVAGATFLDSQDIADHRANPRPAITRQWAMSRFPQLARPTFAKLEIAAVRSRPGEGSERLKVSFKAGEPVNFRLLITNVSKESVALPAGGPYDHNRPRLLRDGRTVPYSKEAERLAQRGDNMGYRSVRYEQLETGQTVADTVDLTDWYEPLQPGEYSLTVQHRFILGGDWLDSPSINFEVIP